MNKRDEYNKKINSLENIIVEKTNENIDIHEEIKNLSTRRDNTMLLGMPFGLTSSILIFCGVNSLTQNPILVASAAILVGVTLVGISVHDLKLGLKISKLNKKMLENGKILTKKEEEKKLALELLEEYEKNESLNNEMLKQNKSNFVNNNHIVNSVTNSRNKIRSLSLQRKNNIRN